MATPTTVNTWPLNGSIQEFDVTFDYLSQTFIKVNLVGPTGLTLLTLGTDYTFVTPTRIRTVLVYGPPNFTTIEIRRETSTTERLVEFQDASILHAQDLNVDALQVMHVAEEARNAATETLGVNGDGNLDARYRRIVNVGNAVDRKDAFTYGQYQDDRNGTLAAKQDAEAARDKAHEWATSPNVVDGTLRSSKHYAEQAASSSTFSYQRATFSDQRATFSDKRATASAVSASESAYSAADSLNARLVSEEYAQWPVDVTVSTGGYSALHWATKAETWAKQAGSVPLAVKQVASAVRSMYAGLIGVPVPYPSTDIPEGWVEMRGQSFNTAQNPLLAAKYPSGVLPDMRKRFIRGTGADRGALTFEGNENKSHSHTITVSSGGTHGHTGSSAYAGDHTHTVSGTAASAGGHTHTVPAGWVTKYYRPGDVDAGLMGNPSAAVTSSTAGDHTHTVSGTAASAGGHTHTVSIAAGGDHSHTATATAEGSTDSRPDNIAFVWCCMTDAAIPELPTIGT